MNSKIGLEQTLEELQELLEMVRVLLEQREKVENDFESELPAKQKLQE